MKDERGQVLALALAALAVGVLLISPFLNTVSVHSIASRTYSSSISQQYAADAGIEDAIWALTSGTLASQLTYAGASVSHTVSEQINGISPTVSVTRDTAQVASEDFESGGWSGGSGWLAAWSYSGDSSVTSSGTPYQGSYHLRLRSSTGYCRRSIDLLAYSSARLLFRAKASSFESGEEAYCRVSSDGSSWTTVKTWRDGDDDGVYRYWNIDLSMYTLSSQFCIAFQANMSATNDYLYIDNIEIARVFPGAVVGLPRDDFESGGWSGGSGWLASWSTGGSASVITGDSPYQGLYHVRLRSSGSYASRSANLSGQSGLHLTFWAKVNSFEPSDTLACRVSLNGSTWTTVKTWTSADSDNTYRYNDIDLSSFAPYSSQFWIRFYSGMNQTSDYFYLDALGLSSGAIAYEITSTAGDTTIRSDIILTGGVVTISLWERD